MAGIDIDKFRNIIQGYIERHHYIAAVFWADKVVTLSSANPVDVYWLAQTYYLSKQYHRAILLLNSHNLQKNQTCRYLMALCHYEAGDHQLALATLECHGNFGKQVDVISIPQIDNAVSTKCSIELLKGNIYEASDNRLLASDCFKAAVLADPLCFEAMNSLCQHQMLTAKEETDLMSSLPLSLFCNETEAGFVELLYGTRLNKYSCITTEMIDHRVENSMTKETFELVSKNNDFITAKAESLYYQCNFSAAYKLTQEVLKHDAYDQMCLPIHISCLVELKQYNGKNEQARRFLSKSTSLDKVFGPAWIAYGHSFAAENEHDQAMAAYFKAAQIMRGCHLPLLYIGMEYSLTNNPKFAEKFYKEALEIAPKDPFVLHELAVVAFNNQEYEVAEKYFGETVALVESSCIDVLLERSSTFLNNLGHTYRKMKKYPEAIHCHQQSLRLSPGSLSTYTSLSLVLSLMGNYEGAVVGLHKALSLQRDDTIATTLLSKVMEQLMLQEPAFQGDDNMIEFEDGFIGEISHSDRNELNNSMISNIVHPQLNENSVDDQSTDLQDMTMDDQSF